jgi:rsbT antagonist protein RsbS
MPVESISVIKVYDILIVTVPAEPDDETIAMLQKKILEAMERHNARGLILDISNVETLDSFFARTIVETAQMVELMGGRTVIAGMRTSVAITATQLGLSFGRIHAALNVERALILLEDLSSREA